MTFALAPLPYDYDALEPVISRETMMLHHDKHHAAYTAKLNEAVDADAALAGKTIEELFTRSSTLPPVVRNNGGGFWNHDFFWKVMAPPSTTQASDALMQAIASYGGFDKLKEDFNAAGANVFGSGWVWLIKDSTGALRVTSTPNQDNPLMDVVADKGTPILGNDVWEHAYYLTYRNDRAGYLRAWWDVANWEEASRRFVAA